MHSSNLVILPAKLPAHSPANTHSLSLIHTHARTYTHTHTHTSMCVSCRVGVKERKKGKRNFVSDNFPSLSSSAFPLIFGVYLTHFFLYSFVLYSRVIISTTSLSFSLFYTMLKWLHKEEKER